MRNFLVLLALLGIGGFIYTHQDLPGIRSFFPGHESSPLSGPVLINGPYAFQRTLRTSSYGPFLKDVVVVEGDRWRVEAYSPKLRRVITAISDGSVIVTDPPSYWNKAALDPRKGMGDVLTAAASVNRANAHLSGLGTVQCDGHACLKATVQLNNISVRLWVDSSTGVVVCLMGSENGHYVEEHFSRIPINFDDPDTAEFFDAAHTQPFFGRFLEP